MKKVLNIEFLFFSFVLILAILILLVIYYPYEIRYIVEQFKIPLYFIAGFIPISGLIIAYQRMSQTEIQNNFINFENTFFHLINLLLNYVENISHGQTHGRKVLEEFYNKLHKNARSYDALGARYDEYKKHMMDKW